ncbi:MAG: hypothetical protein K0S32_4175 [Bacteroidetes bacterium]|jgi:hypothetical protein|nr:hypothetical protein [Bacteroidota bacterium]
MEIHNTLNWLFERYLEDPVKSWDITLCNNKEENDRDKTHAFGKHLTRKGYVKNVHYTKTGFECCITTLGILQVSNLLDELKYKILEAYSEDQKNSAVEILDIESKHFQRVLDTTSYLKRMGLIECIIKENDVLIKPTSFGEEWYKNNRKVFA